MGTFDKGDRKDVADAAKETVSEMDAPRVKPLSELLSMSWDEMNDYLVSIGAEPISDEDRERARDAVLVDMGDDALAMDRGKLSPAMRDRLLSSAEKALVSAARGEANRLMSREELRGMFENDPRPASEQGGVWCSCGSGCCPDCEGLHGTVLAMDMWEGVAPHDATNACGDKCRCRIMPCSMPDGTEGLRSEDMRQGR